ncbi:MAG: endonuclease III [Roseiflexaceae bacterium]
MDTAQQRALEPLAERAQIIYQLTGQAYGIRAWAPRREPLHELISTILSQRTTGANEERAFRQLWARFGSWEAIAAAPEQQIAEQIAPSNWAEVKAPRIKAVLGQIIAERGAPDIGFLAGLPTEQAMVWLLALPGVGLKTASLVLLFCFRKPVLPVDTHVHRVSQRVGLIGPRATPEQAHTLLPPLLPRDAEVLWNFHHNLLRHGQRVCIWRDPRCGRCVLLDHCDYGRAHTTGMVQ